MCSLFVQSGINPFGGVFFSWNLLAFLASLGGSFGLSDLNKISVSKIRWNTENLVKRKDSKLRSQSRRTFIDMLTDSQHTCVRVSDLLFMNCHSISQDITRFSYIIMSTSCTCYYVNQVRWGAVHRVFYPKCFIRGGEGKFFTLF